MALHIPDDQLHQCLQRELLRYLTKNAFPSIRLVGPYRCLSNARSISGLVQVLEMCRRQSHETQQPAFDELIEYIKGNGSVLFMIQLKDDHIQIHVWVSQEANELEFEHVLAASA